MAGCSGQSPAGGVNFIYEHPVIKKILVILLSCGEKNKNADHQHFQRNVSNQLSNLSMMAGLNMTRLLLMRRRDNRLLRDTVA